MGVTAKTFQGSGWNVSPADEAHQEHFPLSCTQLQGGHTSVRGQHNEKQCTMFCLRSPTTPPSTHTPHIWVCVHGSSFSGHASLGLNMALECVCALIQCVCVCVRLHDCPLISTIWAHSLPAVSPVTKRSGWLSAAINNTNKRSAAPAPVGITSLHAEMASRIYFL